MAPAILHMCLRSIWCRTEKLPTSRGACRSLFPRPFPPRDFGSSGTSRVVLVVFTSGGYLWSLLAFRVEKHAWDEQ